MNTFNANLLEKQDYDLALTVLTAPGAEDPSETVWRLEHPDLVIAPDCKPYLYRWHLIPRNSMANLYLHIQVASDPGRPLHDHPYDNQSVILAGGYAEIMHEVDPVWLPGRREPYAKRREVCRFRRKGDTVHRRAEEAHRLILPPEVPYTMTLFSTGPRRRDWGFYAPSGWVTHEDIIENVGGVSVVKEA